jgi:hypothetical protein
VVGDDEAEHGVTEELESLVGGLARRLGDPRAVGQGASQELRIGEPMGQAPAKRLERGLGAQLRRR